MAHLFWTVVLAAASAVLLGMLWYHPRVFGTAWMQLGHITPDHAERAARRMNAHSALAFIACLIIAAALAYLARALDLRGISGSLQLTLIAWAGFAAPLLAGSFLWEQRSVRFYLINVTYWLLVIVIASLIVVP